MTKFNSRVEHQRWKKQIWSIFARGVQQRIEDLKK